MTEASLRLRQGVYRVLSAGFAPPSPEYLSVAADSITVLEEFGLYDYAYAPEISEMLRQFGDADVDDLRRLHQQLFETGVEGEVCVVREAARLGDPRSGGPARLLAELRAAHARFGLEPPADQIDHAATELASMAAVCGRLAEHPDEGDGLALLRRQVDFAHDHVLRWIPTLGREVEALARHPAHRALGTATVAFLEHERQHLPMLLGDSSAGRR